MKLSEAREVLGIGPDDGLEEARRAYRKLALVHHPDKSDAPDATATFQRVRA